MDLRNRDGDPLVPWDDPESAFEAWKAASKGRPCDYSGMTYAALRQGPIQWPCTEAAPGGTERLYVDGRFNTDPAYCETYGLELATGADVGEEAYRAADPGGRAILRADAYRPAPEEPDDEHPMVLTTGRTIYHFHTRTKTGRAPELDAAAPSAWVELSASDARSLDIAEGDVARVVSRRGAIEAPVRISGVRPGTVFVPFHYGYWDAGDAAGPDGHPGTAANELTLTAWDPVSKQPLFKVAAVRVERVRDGDGPAPAPEIGGSAPVGPTNGGSS
jgi:anaerobic selenocysteine-containing dehydrogenase